MKESISYYSSSGCLGLHDAGVIVCLPGWDAKVSGLSSYNKAGKAGWLPALATVADGLVVAADGGLEFCFVYGLVALVIFSLSLHLWRVNQNQTIYCFLPPISSTRTHLSF